MHGPNPNTIHPLEGYPQTVFLKNVITNANISVGDFSYYDDPDGAEQFEKNNVRYHFDFLGDKLIIGKFVAIAKGAHFIMNGANHLMDGFSTFPFNIFGNGWDEGFDTSLYSKGSRGDTIVGHDVWIGNGARILPGVTIGNGAIVGASAVVASNVPAYGVVVGNPGKLMRMRFDETTIDALSAIAWWDWPVEKISRNLGAIRGNNLAALRVAA